MEKFEELSQEKQRRIIDAGMEMFGRYEYKKANTEDIAAKAGISKGLLFYYFKDKKSFYMYLFQYCVTIVTKTLDDEDFTKITDFFALMEFGAQKKMQIMVEHPFILDFICRAFSSRREAVSSDVAMELHSLMDTTFDRFFAHVDFSKFNNDVDPKQVYQMLVWMTEGYMHEKLSCPVCKFPTVLPHKVLVAAIAFQPGKHMVVFHQPRNKRLFLFFLFLAQCKCK